MDSRYFRLALPFLLALSIQYSANAQFTSKVVTSLGGFGIPESLVAADFDGDGKTDVMTRDMGYELQWYKNNGSGTFSQSFFSLPDSDLPGLNSVVAFDADKDGDQDVVATYTDNYKGKVLLWKNSGNGSFLSAITLASNLSEVATLHAVDIDKDGDLDIALATPYERIKWVENKLTTDTWEIHEFSYNITSGYLDIIDFDKDGALDVLTISQGYGIGINGVTIDASLGVSNARFVKAVDLDRDGDYDIIGALQGYESGILWYENKNNNFIKNVFPNSNNIDYRAFTVFDYDSDGDEDFFAGCWFDCNVTLFENTGARTFAVKSISGSGIQQHELTQADIDNDGKIDLLRNDGGSHAVYWLKNGQDQFTGIASDFSYTGTCQNATFEFSHKARGKDLVSWEWDFGDGSAKTTTPASTHVFTTAGDFNVKLTVKNISGQSNSISKMVTVKPAPATDTDRNVTLCVQDFTSSIDVTLPEGFTYKWSNFSDGSDPFNATPTYTYRFPSETYVFKTDANGCSAPKPQKITVKLSDYPYAPQTKGAVSYSGASELLLEATPGANQTIEWVPIEGEEPYHVGNTFRAEVSETTTFYVRAINQAGCKSVRTPVIAAVYNKPLLPAPEFVWADPTQSEAGSEGLAMKADGNGNYYAFGYWPEKNFIVGNFTLPSVSSSNFYLINYNKDGVPLDAKNLGQSAYWQDPTFEIDTDKSIYLTMMFTNSVKIGGTQITAPEADKYFSLVVKLNSNGTYVWHKMLTTYGPKIALANDNVILLTSNNSYSLMSALSKTNGDVAWEAALVDMFARDVHVDPAGNILAAGSSQGSINNATVVKYSPSGSLIWQKAFVTGGNISIAFNVKTDADNNVIVVGTYSTGYLTANDPMITILGEKVGGGRGLFIAKANSNGDRIWAKQILGASNQVNDLYVNGGGDILMTGDYDSELSFDGIVFPKDSRTFIAGYSSQGEFRWVKATNKARILGVAGDGQGGAIMHGEFPDDVQLDNLHVFSRQDDPYPLINYNTITARLAYRLKADFKFDAACSNSETKFQDWSIAESGTTLVEWDWEFGDGSTSTEQYPKHTYANGGVYNVRLTVKDDLNRTISKTGQVTVASTAPSPQVLIQSPGSVCENLEVHYKAIVSNAGSGFSLNWYVDGVVQPVYAGSTTFDLATDHEKEVKVIVDAPALQCVLSHTAEDAKTIPVIEVPAKPVIEALENEICEGSMTTISTSSTAAVYVWSSGASTSEITVGNSDTYSLQIGNTANCLSDRSESIEIAVNPKPVATITVTGNLLTASEGASYKWYQNGDIIDETSQQLSAESSGFYKVEVFSALGCSEVSPEVNITIIGLEDKITTDVIVSPNPVRDQLFIQTVNRIKSVKLVDVFGRQVIDAGQSNVVNVSGVAVGAYLLIIDVGSGIVTKRIIKI